MGKMYGCLKFFVFSQVSTRKGELLEIFFKNKFMCTYSRGDVDDEIRDLCLHE